MKSLASTITKVKGNPFTMCGRGISENVQTSFSVRLTIGYHWIQPQSILSNARILLLKYDK